MRVVLVAVLLSGCVVTPNEARPGQAEAVELAWGVYGSPEPAPGIHWMAGADLDCMDGFGWTDDATGVGETCLQGRSLIAQRVAQIAIREGDRFSETALVHELYHFALHDLTGDADAWHEGAGWGRYVYVGDEGGYQRGVVDDALDALKATGL